MASPVWQDILVTSPVPLQLPSRLDSSLSTEYALEIHEHAKVQSTILGIEQGPGKRVA